MNDIQLALVISSLLSVLLSLIQIASQSKVYIVKSYFTVLLAFYVLIMIVGNVLTTLISASVIENYTTSASNGSEQGRILLVGPLWIWYSAFGVFGFEALIQKMNITFFDKGVLSINDWITKAKNSATAATLERAADLEIINILNLATELHNQLDKAGIHTLASNNLGNDRYQDALNGIQGNNNIDPELYLTHILANESPKIVKSAIEAHKKNHLKG